MASISRGDQSSSPFRHASLTAVITDPVTAAVRFCTAQKVSRVVSSCRREVTYLPVDAVFINFYIFYKVSQTLDWLGAKRSLECGKLKACLYVCIKVKIVIGRAGFGV